MLNIWTQLDLDVGIWKNLDRFAAIAWDKTLNKKLTEF